METGWIQVFVLLVSECVAPEGKTVCQQREFDLTFVDRADCELALEQLVGLKERADDVIVDRDATRCVMSARQSRTFPNLAAIDAIHGADEDWQPPARPEDQQAAQVARAAYEKRLAALPACDEIANVPPCRVGDIIIEQPEGQPVEVWRRQE